MTAKLAAALIAGSLAIAGPAFAHHSYAMFDRTKAVTFDGVVKDFQWTNPHIFIEVSVPETNKTYSVEGTSPGVLRREGWKFNSLKVGDRVTVAMAPLKDGRLGGSLLYVMKDGVKLGDPTAIKQIGGGLPAADKAVPGAAQ